MPLWMLSISRSRTPSSWLALWTWFQDIMAASAMLLIELMAPVDHPQVDLQDDLESIVLVLFVVLP